ncbi:MAG: DUF374 domain-containing protein [Gemmataceae bacterium]|nr:DUF374 domain-containing protein [Gemmataceae bacterium]
MKIRNPKTIQRLARVGGVLLKAWNHTLRFSYRPLTSYLLADRPDLIGNSRFIYAFWHEYIFVPAYLYARPDMAVLSGMHADSQFLEEMTRRYGLKSIKGSTTRGGTTGLLKMLRDGEGTRHFTFTPDGPKGPRRKSQFGLVYLASRSGLPIVPVGFGYSKCWRASNWDRFAIPRPFSRVRCVTGHPIHVPPKLGKEELEVYVRILNANLEHATTVAERWAQTGEFDQLGYVAPNDAEVIPAHHKAWPSQRLLGRG